MFWWKTHLQLKLFSADSLPLIKVNVFDSKMYLLAIEVILHLKNNILEKDDG